MGRKKTDNGFQPQVKRVLEELHALIDQYDGPGVEALLEASVCVERASVSEANAKPILRFKQQEQSR